MPGSLFDSPHAAALRSQWQKREKDELLLARAKQVQRSKAHEEHPPTIRNKQTGLKISIIGKSWAKDFLMSITIREDDNLLFIAPEVFLDAIKGLKQSKIRWWQFMAFFDRFHVAYDSKNIWDQMAVYEMLAVTQQCSVHEAVCLTVLDGKGCVDLTDTITFIQEFQRSELRLTLFRRLGHKEAQIPTAI